MTHSTTRVAPGQNAVVAAFLVSDGKVLVARRPKSKKIAGGLWHLPGGHLEQGEAPPQALVREIKEEFQVAISVGDLIHEFQYIEHGKPTAGFVFMATLEGDPSALRFDPTDTAAIVWARPEDVEALFSDHADDHNLVAITKGFQWLLRP